MAVQDPPGGHESQEEQIKASWEPALRRISEDLATAKARLAQEVAKNPKPASVPRLTGEYLVECLDVQAYWSLFGVRNGDQIASFYEPYLREAFEEVLRYGEQLSANWRPPAIHRERFLATLRIKLQARLLHWQAEALTRVRKISSEAVPEMPHDNLDRRAAVDAYILEVSQTTGQRISRTDFWKKAGDKTRTEFERWEGCWYEKRGSKVNCAADRRFRRILKDKPHLKGPAG